MKLGRHSLASLRVSPRLLLALTPFALAASLVASDAAAQWPPPKDATSADFAQGKYWPNDPGYAYSDTDSGQWNFYSFIPSISKNILPASKGGQTPQETAAGMSIDLAWRHTIGDSSVVIAVTDSGIEWDQTDLVDKIYLNAGELANHKPTHADGSACGGAGALAGFDCNGDGVFSVSDYYETPALAMDPSTGLLKGDKNGNGILDPGDLILLFSDGIDDDGNGYIDDIAGWDFMKDDNDPYDDTRYGHGTGEARDSSAQTNNGNGDAGVCPNCRIMPMRVGDSFITDVTDFGKAVVYATDNGAGIVQCALGTINMNKFAQSALDYAYAKGVLTITSMADENSRHHNVPAAANHTLPVHAIVYDGMSLSDSTTFVAFHPCSNYGGQNLLSASGSSCSSEATGKLSGIAGLLVSASREMGLDPPLAPGEAQSLFFMTADDVNVPASHDKNSAYRWSQKGFDQRFGYGRVNANSVIEAMQAGRIPPSVDVTSPTWFSVLYKDQATAPVAVVGSVGAKRAPSYDYVVEWGAGVQPLDDAFTEVFHSAMIPGDTVTDGTLATLDLSKIDPTHTRDPDSPNGENDTAITVRVRATAHYGGSIGDVPGEMRRTYYVQKDPDLVAGFPIYMGESGELSPKMADLDGDGVRELIVPTSGGRLHVFKMTPNGPVELPGFPFQALREDGLLEPVPTPDTPSYLAAPAYQAGANPGVDPDLAGEPFGIAPAIGDIDGDGKLDIVLSTYTGSIYAIDLNGQIKPGFPIRLPLVPSCPLPATDPPTEPCMDELHSRIARGAFAAPVLIDMNQDGKLDIIQASFDGKVYIFDGQGQPLPGWPVSPHYTGALSAPPAFNRILSTPAVGDFNGDGIPDVLVGSNEKLGPGEQAGAIYLIDGRGTNAPQTIFPNWPATLTSFDIFPLVAEGVPNAGVIARYNGQLTAIMHGNVSAPFILPLDPGTQAVLGATPTNALPPKHKDPLSFSGYTQGIQATSDFGKLSKATPDVMFPLFAQPSLGDLDQDGVPDIITSGGSLSLANNLAGRSASAVPGQQLVAMWSGKTGEALPASPIPIEDFTFFNSQAIVDLNGDDYPEVITGSGGYFVHAFDACGREPDGWPKFTGQWVIPTPAVGDIDGDGKLEVAIATRDGWLYAWHTEATTDSIIEWESFHHDNQNTGNIETPLTQGGKHKAKKPLTAEVCRPSSMTSSSASASASSGSGSTSSGMLPTHDLVPGGGCDCSTNGETPSAPPLALAGVALAAAVVRRRRTASPRRRC